jgi:hypothetical protein
VEDAKNRLKELKSLSTDEIQRKIDEEYNSSIDNNKKYYDQKIELKNRYQRVLEEVYQWQPPTPEHVKLKEYAINQLKDSIEWDCGSAYLYLKKIKKNTSTEWIKRRTESCLKDIDYHSKEYNEEVKRVNERNDWIRLLRASL